MHSKHAVAVFAVRIKQLQTQFYTVLQQLQNTATAIVRAFNAAATVNLAQQQPGATALNALTIGATALNALTIVAAEPSPEASPERPAAISNAAANQPLSPVPYQQSPDPRYQQYSPGDGVMTIDQVP